MVRTNIFVFFNLFDLHYSVYLHVALRTIIEGWDLPKSTATGRLTFSPKGSPHSRNIELLGDIVL